MYSKILVFVANEISKIINAVDLVFPLTITLKSSDVSRKIEISTDCGIEYFQPAVDVTSATMLVINISAPITHIKVTGVENDKVIIGY